MSTRERWIVYPLLFLAIGLGLRSGIQLSTIEQQSRLEIDTVQCKAIQVVDGENRPRIFIHADPRDRSGVIDVISTDGQVVTSLRANEVGSALRLGSQRRRSELTLSNSGNQPSIAYQRSIGNRLIFAEALFLSPEAHRELARALSHLLQLQDRSRRSLPQVAPSETTEGDEPSTPSEKDKPEAGAEGETETAPDTDTPPADDTERGEDQSEPSPSPQP